MVAILFIVEYNSSVTQKTGNHSNVNFNNYNRVISTVDIFVFIEYNNSAADKTAWLSIIDNYNNNRHLSRATVIIFLFLFKFFN